MYLTQIIGLISSVSVVAVAKPLLPHIHEGSIISNNTTFNSGSSYLPIGPADLTTLFIETDQPIDCQLTLRAVLGVIGVRAVDDIDWHARFDDAEFIYEQGWILSYFLIGDKAASGAKIPDMNAGQAYGSEGAR